MNGLSQRCPLFTMKLECFRSGVSGFLPTKVPIEKGVLGITFEFIAYGAILCSLVGQLALLEEINKIKGWTSKKTIVYLLTIDHLLL